MADVYYKKSQSLLSEGNYELSLSYADKSIALNPMEPNYYRGRAKALIVSIAANVDLTKEQALKDLQKAYKLNPKNLVTIRNCIPLYYFLAADNLSLPGSPSNVDEKYVPFAYEFYSFAKTQYPNDVGVYVLIAKYEKRLGLEKEFNDSIKRISILRPDLLEWQESLR